MLELTSLRHGAVVNQSDGVETGSGLEIQIEGLAEPWSLVLVNGRRARLAGRVFRAPVRLTCLVNDIVVSSRNKHGESQQRISVVWDRASFRRYNVFTDDNAPVERLTNGRMLNFLFGMASGE